MHICILADTIDNQRAGVHVYTKRLIEELLKIGGHKYSFIHEQENGFFKGLNHYIIPRKKRLGYGTYRKFFLIPRLIRKLKPDVVFEPCHIGPFFTKAKKVVMVHDLTPVLMPKLHIKRSTLIHRLLFKQVLKKADLILTASNQTKDDVKNYSETSAQIKTIPLGIDAPPRKLSSAEFFLQKGYPKPKNTNTRDISALKNIPTISKPYLLYLGTIEPRKNLETLIDAFAEIKTEKKIPHQLILAGEIGWKSEKILEKVTETNKRLSLPKQKSAIEVPGYVDESTKQKLYQNAEIFIYPSLYEGFGLPPLEAMSYGIPVICSTGGSLKELFENHALMFEPHNKKILKNHILNLIKNKELAQILSEKGKKYAQQFSWKKTAEKTLECIISA